MEGKRMVQERVEKWTWLSLMLLFSSFIQPPWTTGRPLPVPKNTPIKLFSFFKGALPSTQILRIKNYYCLPNIYYVLPPGVPVPKDLTREGYPVLPVGPRSISCLSPTDSFDSVCINLSAVPQSYHSVPSSARCVP